jgi:aminotransferase
MTNRSRSISARAAALPGNSLVELFLLARQRGAVDLAVGTPGFPETADALVSGASQAMRDGHNQYELPAGNPDLRRVIAETVCHGADPATEITVTVGATEALFMALMATVDPGDEVVVFSPGFELFAQAAALTGAVPRFVPLDPATWRWDPADLAAAFGPRTRAVLVNTPANPTGRVLGADEWAELAELCQRWDVTVICDEVYRGFVYDGREHLSAADVPGLGERSIVVGSLSKSHAVSGWRLGFVRADPARTVALRRVHEMTTNGTAAPLQLAAGAVAAAVDVAAAAGQMAVRRNLAQGLCAGMGLKFVPAEGGCFLFADISPLTGGHTDSAAFARELLERCGVLVVPGGPFFPDSDRGAQYVRVAFNRRPETLREAERRILGPI